MSAEGQKPTMDPDPTRPEPDDDATAAGSDPDLVDAIALEAVTSAAVPTPEPAAAGDGADPMIGRHLGAYRLVSRIGGNDRVRFYLAERVGSFEQRAAVKVVEPAMGGEAIVRRFRATSRIHAALSGHPNLAGLLDAGTDEDGRSYLVMEAVDGRPIDAHCDERRLDVPARLRLFAQVCDA